MKYILFFLGCFSAFTLSAQTAPSTPCLQNGQPVFSGDDKVIDDGPVVVTPPDQSIPPNITDDRLVFWLHGLTGSANSWIHPATVTQYQAAGQEIPGYPMRKVTSIRPTYSEFSLSGAAAEMHNKLVLSDPLCVQNNITDKTHNFIIAHSQGGIVARATDKFYSDLGWEDERRFGGIVTYTSPHQGAALLNNMNLLQPFMNEGLNALGAGLEAEIEEKNTVLDFFIPGQTLADIREKLSSAVSNLIAPLIIGQQTTPLANDYKVGAVPLAELNAYSSTLKNVAIISTEDEPVFYRELYSIKVKTPTEFPPFGANDDNGLVDRFNNLLQKYEGKYQYHKAQAVYLEQIGLPCNWIMWITNPAFCSVYDTKYWQHVEKRDKWKLGRDWLLDSNFKYKVMIGVAGTTSQFIPNYHCKCGNGVYTFPISNPPCPQGCELIDQSTTQLVRWSKPNDGVVSTETQRGFDGAFKVEIYGNNHQEVRNSENTKMTLNNLFDGNYRLYFKTDKRQ